VNKNPFRTMRAIGDKALIKALVSHRDGIDHIITAVTQLMTARIKVYWLLALLVLWNVILTWGMWTR
jgi:hypothetical protein